MSASVDPVQAHCRTGNCSWPITPSLAICGGCAPIFPVDTNCNSTACNFTMASGSVFELTTFPNTFAEGVGFQTMETRGQHWNMSVMDHLYITHFDMMGAPYNSIAGTATAANMRNASECALWWCINEYNTSFSSGQQTQHVVSSFSEISYPQDTSITNYTFKFPNSTAGTEDGSYTNYTVEFRSMIALQDQFASGSSGYGSPINGTVSLRSGGYLTSSDVTFALWAGTQNQSEWIQTLATSMSNIVRINGQVPRTIYDGTAYVQGITIEWWWISLPVATVMGSIILLVIVMIRTARSPVKAWKSNPMALLLFGVDEVIKLAAADVALGKGMSNDVGRRTATLGKTEENIWIFKNHQSSIDSKEEK